MSYKAWAKKFYPKEPVAGMSKRKALEHSIRKWTGLLPENLEKYGLTVHDRYVQEDGLDMLEIDASSCALCHNYLFAGIDCHGCPLYKSLRHRCDAIEHNAPYNKFVNKGQVKPMLKALQNTLRKMEEGKL